MKNKLSVADLITLLNAEAESASCCCSVILGGFCYCTRRAV